MSNLVMYLRLSLEDDVNADESNSITNQRRIIRDYISSHEDLRSMTVTEKCDDGYSGTNMNRPGMQELLAMVKEQRVDCIIVKDMSRCARNYLETRKYIEQIFPFMGCLLYTSSAYSRGMKQKLLIMAAIIHEPNLIVMDEPFTGLDPSTVEQLIKVINAERERGAGILFPSHMLDIVTRISDKVVVIKNGNILIDDEIANVNHSGCLQKLLVGESNESAE